MWISKKKYTEITRRLDTLERELWSLNPRVVITDPEGKTVTVNTTGYSIQIIPLTFQVSLKDLAEEFVKTHKYVEGKPSTWEKK